MDVYQLSSSLAISLPVKDIELTKAALIKCQMLPDIYVVASRKYRWVLRNYAKSLTHSLKWRLRTHVRAIKKKIVLHILTVMIDL